MASYRCAECGQEHDESEIELGFRRPDAFVQTPWWRRWWKTKASSDLCILGGKRFFVRGVVELPVVDRPGTYCIGAWAEVPEEQFWRYVEYYHSERLKQLDESITGKIANHIPALYQRTTLGLPVKLNGSTTERPRLIITEPGHSLAQEQASGITRHRAHQLTSLALGGT